MPSYLPEAMASWSCALCVSGLNWPSNSVMRDAVRRGDLVHLGLGRLASQVFAELAER